MGVLEPFLQVQEVRPNGWRLEVWSLPGSYEVRGFRPGQLVAEFTRSGFRTPDAAMTHGRWHADRSLAGVRLKRG